MVCFEHTCPPHTSHAVVFSTSVSQTPHLIFIFTEDRKNATGHLSASVVGKLELVLTMLDFPSNYTLQVDVFSHSHNIMQHRAGGVVKALN